MPGLYSGSTEETNMSTAIVPIVTPEERAERERESASLVIQAGALAIETHEIYTEAATWLRDVILPMKRKITDTFRPRISQAHALHKGLCDDERRFLTHVEGAERVVKGKLAAYDQTQADLRRAADQAAQRERERLEREAREQAAAEQRRLTAEAEDRRLAEAAAMEARGDGAAATRLLEAPIAVPIVMPAPVFAPVPMAAAATVAGVSYRDSWRAEVTDLPLRIKAVAAG